MAESKGGEAAGPIASGEGSSCPPLPPFHRFELVTRLVKPLVKHSVVKGSFRWETPGRERMANDIKRRGAEQTETVYSDFKDCEDNLLCRVLAEVYIDEATGSRRNVPVSLGELVSRVQFESVCDAEGTEEIWAMPFLGDEYVHKIRFADADTTRTFGQLYQGLWASGSKGDGLPRFLYDREAHTCLEHVYEKILAGGGTGFEKALGTPGVVLIDLFPRQLLAQFPELQTTKTSEDRRKFLDAISTYPVNFSGVNTNLTYVGEQLFRSDFICATGESTDSLVDDEDALPWARRLVVQFAPVSSQQRQSAKRYANVLEALLGDLFLSAEDLENVLSPDQKHGELATVLRILALYIVGLVFERALDCLHGEHPRPPAYQNADVQRDFESREADSWLQQGSLRTFLLNTRKDRMSGLLEELGGFLRSFLGVGREEYEETHERFSQLGTLCCDRFARAGWLLGGDSHQVPKNVSPALEFLRGELKAADTLFAALECDHVEELSKFFQSEWECEVAGEWYCMACQGSKKKPKLMEAGHVTTQKHLDRMQRYREIRSGVLVNRGHFLRDEQERSGPLASADALSSRSAAEEAPSRSAKTSFYSASAGAG